MPIAPTIQPCLRSRAALSILAGLVITGLHDPAAADTVTYRLTVDNTWSEETHPGAFPPNAHFAWIGGAPGPCG